MTLAATALIAALGLIPLQQSEDAPRVETRTEVRVIDAGGPGGRGGLDADADGVVTREEFSAPMTTAFDRLDADRDGRLTTEELAAGHHGEGPDDTVVMMHRGPGGPGDREPMILRHGGPGGDRQVFMFRHGGPRGGPGGGPEGHAGPGERRIEVHRFGGPGDEGGMDTDNDGKVSEAEFLAPLREAFQRLDADRDGSLGAGEGHRGPVAPPAR